VDFSGIITFDNQFEIKYRKLLITEDMEKHCLHYQFLDKDFDQ